MHAGTVGMKENMWLRKSRRERDEVKNGVIDCRVEREV